jgi:hypothetical protein
MRIRRALDTARLKAHVLEVTREGGSPLSTPRPLCSYSFSFAMISSAMAYGTAW